MTSKRTTIECTKIEKQNKNINKRIVKNNNCLTVNLKKNVEAEKCQENRMLKLKFEIKKWYLNHSLFHS